MVPEIELTAFAPAHADGAVVIDVREPLEYVAGGAAGWLRNAGVDAVSVAGGTSGWQAQGRPVVLDARADESAA